MLDWGEVFLPSAPIAETIIRGTVMFLVIYALMRVVGQREGGAHSLSDLLVVVLVAQAAASGMVGETSAIADSVLLIVTVLGWSIAIDALAYRVPAFRKVLQSRRTPLVVDGKINQKSLRREFMSRDELMSELRIHGIDDIDQVARAYLEANGMVSVIPREGREVETPLSTPGV